MWPITTGGTCPSIFMFEAVILLIGLSSVTGMIAVALAPTRPVFLGACALGVTWLATLFALMLKVIQ